jgi:hypothetical protein
MTPVGTTIADHTLGRYFSGPLPVFFAAMIFSGYHFFLGLGASTHFIGRASFKPGNGPILAGSLDRVFSVV